MTSNSASRNDSTYANNREIRNEENVKSQAKRMDEDGAGRTTAHILHRSEIIVHLQPYGGSDIPPRGTPPKLKHDARETWCPKTLCAGHLPLIPSPSREGTGAGLGVSCQFSVVRFSV